MALPGQAMDLGLNLYPSETSCYSGHSGLAGPGASTMVNVGLGRDKEAEIPVERCGTGLSTAHHIRPVHLVPSFLNFPIGRWQ